MRTPTRSSRPFTRDELVELASAAVRADTDGDSMKVALDVLRSAESSTNCVAKTGDFLTVVAEINKMRLASGLWKEDDGTRIMARDEMPNDVIVGEMERRGIDTATLLGYYDHPVLVDSETHTASLYLVGGVRVLEINGDPANPVWESNNRESFAALVEEYGIEG